ncbi:putative alpha-L-fucosidase 1 [Oryza brachyantha]|uniref:alpha-L-fucosidase n=1 Tax=Oryza brachyantha TaxID=4533 RepID=A6MCZ0_ORYBR|nr:putative alpha-L-fucosidase 1 [Oryza brachyantha]ABG73453.1 glycosyl hydrolase family 29 [Oryza brachyantha]
MGSCAPPWCVLAAAVVAAVMVTSLAEVTTTPPPLPVLPVPTAAQLRWQRREVIMFFHFGMNTFTDSEWGTGREDPAAFRPAALNATQWMDAAAAAGASLVILVAKHHDGFCLWPSAYTAHSVRASPWRGGRGDVVREFADAARARGLDVGLYLSPWDRHDERYGREVAYNEYYLAQLHELLTGYGSVSEIWFDGAKGKNAKNMTYHFQEWFQTVRQLQSSINIFSDDGPDVRWVGDENGSAGSTCWSTVNRSMITIGEAGIEKYLNTGDPRGKDWVPPECDVSIRPGWFWHNNETAKPLSKLLEIYYSSVGRNCVLLLNAPPNTTGLVDDADIAVLREFRAALTTIFGMDLAAGSTATASSERGGGGGFAASNVLDGRDDTYWVPASSDDGRRKEGAHVHEHWIELRRPPSTAGVPFNVVRIQEHVALGQRVEAHDVYVDGAAAVANATTVGHKRLHRLPAPVAGRTVRIRLASRRGPPLVSAVGLHLDPFAAGMM